VTPRLGVRANARQFSLLVLVNAFVGAMVGLERSVLPVLAEESFGLAARSAVLSFIAVFGGTKAISNYLAGRLGDRYGRKPVLVAGWVLALPVPVALVWAPSWGWIVAANALLGVSQGLAWSTTVVMKIDLAGPARRGLAMGLNEFAGYVAVAGAALGTGWLAAAGAGSPFTVGLALAAAGLLLSVFAVRETRGHAALEAAETDAPAPPGDALRRTSRGDPTLASVSRAGLVNNLNDGVAWGLFPLVFAAAGLDLQRIGALAALYPAVWGVGQLVTGPLSDRVGRKPLIVAGMAVQAVGVAAVATATAFPGWAAAAVLLGVGTAMVYPTLLAAVGDAAHPSRRAAAVGTYRLWRDAGYVVGALGAGLIADLAGIDAALWAVAALTGASAVDVALRFREG